MKKIIISGASGFIGEHCLNLINPDEYQIHALSTSSIESSSKVTWHQIDLHNKEQIKKLFQEVKPSHLLHLAWNIKDRDYNGNQHFKWIEIGMNLAQNFYENGGERMVVSGSCFEYDWSNVICRENQTNKSSQFTYGFAKYTLSRMIEKYCQLNNHSYAWGRIFFAYGHGGSSASLIPYVIENLSKNSPVEIKGPHQIKDYIHINDIAKALVLLVNSEVQGAINISNGIPVKIEHIVQKIAQYFRKEELISYNKAIVDFNNLCVIGDNTRMLNELKFTPEFNIEDGLKNTIENYLKQK